MHFDFTLNETVIHVLSFPSRNSNCGNALSILTPSLICFGKYPCNVKMKNVTSSTMLLLIMSPQHRMFIFVIDTIMTANVLPFPCMHFVMTPQYTQSLKTISYVTPNYRKVRFPGCATTHFWWVWSLQHCPTFFNHSLVHA